MIALGGARCERSKEGKLICEAKEKGSVAHLVTLVFWVLSAREETGGEGGGESPRDYTALDLAGG